jgi:hypothetical protein
MTCSSTRLHAGQLYVRKSLPYHPARLPSASLENRSPYSLALDFENRALFSLLYRQALQFGARSPLERHSADTVLIITRSVFSHFKQSKVHRSLSRLAGLTMARTIGALHLAQSRAILSITEAGDGRDVGKRFPDVGREHYRTLCRR